MTLRPPEETFIRTDAELSELWRDLMGPGDFGRRSLWAVFFENDGRMSPMLVPIDDLPDEPDEKFTRNFAWVLRQTIEAPVRSAALLLSRPGPESMTAGDRRWARALHAALDSSLVPWPMHLATAGAVRVFAPDDLIAA